IITKIKKMKKITTSLFAITLSLLTLASCSSDDNVAAPVNHLLGKWEMNTMSMKSTENGQVTLEYTDIPTEGQLVWEYDFKEDNTVSVYMAVPQAQFEESFTGTYIFAENQLTITIEEEPQTFQVNKLDNSNLNLWFAEEEEYQGIVYRDEIEQKFIKK